MNFTNNMLNDVSDRLWLNAAANATDITKEEICHERSLKGDHKIHVLKEVAESKGFKWQQYEKEVRQKLIDEQHKPKEVFSSIRDVLPAQKLLTSTCDEKVLVVYFHQNGLIIITSIHPFIVKLNQDKAISFFLRSSVETKFTLVALQNQPNQPLLKSKSMPVSKIQTSQAKATSSTTITQSFKQTLKRSSITTPLTNKSTTGTLSHPFLKSKSSTNKRKAANNASTVMLPAQPTPTLTSSSRQTCSLDLTEKTKVPRPISDKTSTVCIKLPRLSTTSPSSTPEKNVLTQSSSFTTLQQLPSSTLQKFKLESNNKTKTNMNVARPPSNLAGNFSINLPRLQTALSSSTITKQTSNQNKEFQETRTQPPMTSTTNKKAGGTPSHPSLKRKLVTPAKKNILAQSSSFTTLPKLPSSTLPKYKLESNNKTNTNMNVARSLSNLAGNFFIKLPRLQTATSSSTITKQTSNQSKEFQETRTQPPMTSSTTNKKAGGTPSHPSSKRKLVTPAKKNILAQSSSFTTLPKLPSSILPKYKLESNNKTNTNMNVSRSLSNLAGNFSINLPRLQTATSSSTATEQTAKQNKEFQETKTQPPMPSSTNKKAGETSSHSSLERKLVTPGEKNILAQSSSCTTMPQLPPPILPEIKLESTDQVQVTRLMPDTARKELSIPSNQIDFHIQKETKSNTMITEKQGKN